MADRSGGTLSPPLLLPWPLPTPFVPTAPACDLVWGWNDVNVVTPPDWEVEVADATTFSVLPARGASDRVTVTSRSCVDRSGVGLCEATKAGRAVTGSRGRVVHLLVSQHSLCGCHWQCTEQAHCRLEGNMFSTWVQSMNTPLHKRFHVRPCSRVTLADALTVCTPVNTPTCPKLLFSGKGGRMPAGMAQLSVATPTPPVVSASSALSLTAPSTSQCSRSSKASASDSNSDRVAVHVCACVTRQQKSCRQRGCSSNAQRHALFGAECWRRCLAGTSHGKVRMPEGPASMDCGCQHAFRGRLYNAARRAQDVHQLCPDS